MGNGDIGGKQQNLGSESRPGGGNADDAAPAAAPQILTEEELKVSSLIHNETFEIRISNFLTNCLIYLCLLF